MQSGATATPAAPMRIDSGITGKGSVAGLAALLLLAACLAWLALLPAAATAHDAGPADFSLDRALAHAHFLAQTPRPIAGDANLRARDYLLEKLRALGLAGMHFSATSDSGEAMLSLIRAFGARPLAAIAAPERVYFSVPLAGVLHYPEHIVWDITRVACALCLVVCWALLRRGVARTVPLSLAGVLALLIVVSAARPGASYLLAWPLIGVLLGAGALHLPPAGITYLADATTWKSYWLDGAGARAPTEAPRAGIAFPQVRMLKDEDTPARRKVAFALTSKNAAPSIQLRVEGARVLAARFDGRTLATRRGGDWTLTLHGMGERRLAIDLEIEGGRPARVLIEESIPGLPADAVPARRIDASRNGRTLATDTLVLRSRDAISFANGAAEWHTMFRFVLPGRRIYHLLPH
ncbi:hypothetical protein [Massilia genomosp. 1]|uniref:Uncharacterized protein n=1 Tax=Massilia genomosp. 1 TaxID=2609280 RepID=A0ABX0MIA6_9BURK|nr:hypothetical protein [Massilia genomosp. 1]NHZ62504.1 hypothetical protein [Massilia genomosp. 1]